MSLSLFMSLLFSLPFPPSLLISCHLVSSLLFFPLRLSYTLFSLSLTLLSSSVPSSHLVLFFFSGAHFSVPAGSELILRNPQQDHPTSMNCTTLKANASSDSPNASKKKKAASPAEAASKKKSKTTSETSPSKSKSKKKR